MGKIYGGRWVLGDTIGSGGQGEVFYANDRSGEISGQVALKRLKNLNRAERFVREIQAIKLVDHPHVIKLIDHSPIVPCDNEQPMYIVMPVAAGGDLSKRALVYKGSLDSTLIVALQLASALAAAHSKGVVHRDVKPKNVLFADEGNHAILTDFGICHVHADDRITAPDEAVGPRAFMSPEMEGGRATEVRPAADVYSLGKLIYYMISGGVILPREAIYDAQYSHVFAESGRHHLLRILLGKMICTEEQRLKTMSEVIGELDQIDSWERRAQITPLSADTLGAIRQLQQRALDAQQVAARNDKARQTEAQILEIFRSSFTDWIKVKLKQICDAIHVPGTFECSVREATSPGPLSIGRRDGVLDPMVGFELHVTRPQNTLDRVETLQFFVCRYWKVSVSFGNQLREQPVVDTELTFLPYYSRPSAIPHRESAWRGFLTMTNRRKAPPLRSGTAKAPHVHKTFISENYTLSRKFRISQWPSIQTELAADIGDALDTFVDYLSHGAASIGQ